MNLTRRSFLATSAMAPFTAQGATTPVKDTVPARALPFEMGSVRLLPGPFMESMQQNRDFLRSLEADRLLHTFRLTAGLASPAEPLGGWEKPDIELRGHFTGHYLSACALMSAGMNDDRLREKANLIVAELAKCQKANANGYLSAFPSSFLDRLRDGQKVWAPWYTLHKIMAGLLDMYLLTGNQQALDVAQGMARWTKKWTDTISDEHMARVLQVEFGGTNEVLYNLYAVTGVKDYADAAHRFDHERIFAPLADSRDELKGLHVNTQIPKIIGAARRYELTGDARYRRIAEFFWTQVTQHRSYCTGGTSNFEHWRTGPDILAPELSSSTQECCCTYNMLKLTRHLFQWTPDPRYFDYYERALFNSILGTINPKDGLTMYFVPLASGFWKTYASPRGSFWCCTGTGAESFSKLADSIYFHDQTGLYVNLFIGSEVDWADKGLRVRQETGFPERAETRLRIQAEKPVSAAMRIREPYWARHKMAIMVNGQPAVSAMRSGGYWSIERIWKTGDEIRVSLPMGLHVQALPDDDSMQAVMYGPLVLAGELGRENLTDAMQRGGQDPPEPQGAVPAPEFRAAGGDPNAWIEPVAAQPLAFQTKGQSRDIRLVPLNRIFDQRYGVYWRVRTKQA
ncbi:MAG: glycoside hydrolase family 127 protein [Bryobacteraceae bacterium]